MHHSRLLQFLFLLLSQPLLSYGRSQQPPGRDAILLSRVHSLTLRANRLTTSRRVSPIPQLKCTGPSKHICNLYPIDTMRCTNEGYDYDEEDIQWTCTASLPPEFKLGSTDVVCEGYRDADDKWVLKGSCGVEYRLLLTKVGEERFGSGRQDSDFWPADVDLSGWRGVFSTLGNLIFFGFMVACFFLIMLPMLRDCFGLRGGRRAGGLGRGWGGWGGGGGDGGPYPRGPPPPYTSSGCSDPAPASEPWRPGFWTGALGGAAAGYGLGSRNSRRTPTFRQRRTPSFTRWDDPGEGSSGSRSRSPEFSSTSTSTGFGSTRRR
ncbi:hypothetical protein ASPACDRAFT_62968 [Aspergillus aculeatus ATCC 16872]|uniref:Store-operated calcium entry-associated regulatory factor n=1 Tax=Aspergillus aculeatus (strain ATCC 16872 / CBS 172.66 / WB 5094) TaxID=690307 RepID=A0A1L9WMH1_ASPA1|nr:uncharacterized protein ASPACDRAFT_62968 [Aspergillus aculeatus ATCC 16872]OJJ97300.1 hypothetical protein ASPACDRAFT_62968 [Aspergillus aculeatus ATCC 16872]